MSTIQEQALAGTDEKELPHCDMCGKVAGSSPHMRGTLIGFQC